MILRRDGMSLMAIAEKLGVTPSMVSHYISQMLAELREQSTEAAAEARDLDLMRIDESLSDIEMCLKALRVEAKSGEREASQTIARLTDTKCKLLDRRAKMLGVDAPARSEVTGKDGAPLVEEATPQRIRDVMRSRFGGNVCPEIEGDEATSDGADTGDSPGA